MSWLSSFEEIGVHRKSSSSKKKVVNLGMAKEKEFEGKPIKVITTDLPGMKGVKVLYTGPTIIKENASKPAKK
jgi:hypothetical protein